MMIPRTDNEILYALNIINNKVASYCRTLRIKSINHPQFGMKTINFKLLKHDRVHPTKEGTQIMAKNMISVYRNYGKTQRS